MTNWGTVEDFVTAGWSSRARFPHCVPKSRARTGLALDCDRAMQQSKESGTVRALSTKISIETTVCERYLGRCDDTDQTAFLQTAATQNFFVYQRAPRAHLM